MGSVSKSLNFEYKAQVSLEFLLIIGLSLAVLLVYVNLFMKIKEDTNKFVEEAYVKNLKLILERNVYETCSLGDGNSRSIRINLIRSITIITNSNLLKIENESIYSGCSFADANLNLYKGTLKIKNANGIILLDWYSD
jgi:uncharacterized protein (UPF0333 family)